MYAFCFTSLTFVSGSKVGISPVDLGLVCLSPCGHRTKPLERTKRTMTVLIANCVHTVEVIYI